MTDVLRAHSLSEIHYYLLVMPCAACGKGPCASQGIDRTAGDRVSVRTRCGTCGHEQSLHVVCDGPELDDETALNPTDLPSELIDLGQWLSLHALMQNRARQAQTPFQAHQDACRAAVCLEEALRFYEDGQELPRTGAMFSHASDTAFREHPERFAHRRLIDLHGQLPHLPRQAADRAGPKWWQFWRT